eukprot:CAMPEP_0185903814 /NCGR_PEP_ID=MMETSP0196C-20130402/3087_1 /TAXON_ID=2932 /ORGANISM="Alexandrium fundyense, Strain CCMP1719" /LENGTH=54 /DNA_ID=CAMNT_0028622957 /DNA_START=99 /DNA_END=263 /DNA_ORIENTATION=+
MARTLAGKARKETNGEKRLRRENNSQAQQYAPYVLGGLAGMFVLLFFWLLWVSR